MSERPETAASEPIDIMQIAADYYWKADESWQSAKLLNASPWAKKLDAWAFADWINAKREIEAVAALGAEIAGGVTDAG